MREDTKRAKLLYLGTEHGVYISFDDGANWQSLRQNLPDVPVHDIKVEERDLVIATHGRAFYVLDDISPLRQWGMSPSSTELTLFKPQDALRGLDRTLRIDYQLRQTADKITVEVLDGQNRVIRTFSGTRADSEKKPEPPTPKTSTRRIQNRRRLPACSGSNGISGTIARPISPA